MAASGRTRRRVILVLEYEERIETGCGHRLARARSSLSRSAPKSGGHPSGRRRDRSLHRTGAAGAAPAQGGEGSFPAGCLLLAPRVQRVVEGGVKATLLVVVVAVNQRESVSYRVKAGRLCDDAAI